MLMRHSMPLSSYIESHKRREVMKISKKRYIWWKMKRRIALLLTVLFLTTPFASTSLAQIVVEDADTTWNNLTVGSSDLENSTVNVTSRIIAEYSNTLYKNVLNHSSEIDNVTSSVTPRIVVEYANSLFYDGLQYSSELDTLASSVNSRIIVEYANSIATFDLLEFTQNGAQRPYADPGGPYYGNINEPIQFYGSGIGGEPPYTYAWDFNNDGNTDSTLQNPTHSWPDTGTYRPTLRVKDSNDMSSGLKECSAYVTDSLLEKFAPILYFDKDEKYYPTTIFAMLDHSDLKDENEVILAYKPVKVNNLTTYNDEDYYLDLTFVDVKGWFQNTIPPDPSYFTSFPSNIYARVEPVYGGTALQYWFFYPFNDGFVNVHEGDWEMVQVLLDTNGNPDRVTYSWHLQITRETCDKSDVEWHDTHPFVYVSRGSHANNNDDFWIGETGKIIHPKSVNFQGEELAHITELDENIHKWLNWKGKWGEDTGWPGFNGVHGPKDRDDGVMWSNPIEWANTLSEKGKTFGRKIKDCIYSLKWWSPVNIHIYDQYDNHVGIDENGTFECEIPGLYYSDFEEPVIYILNSSTDNDYRVFVEATGEGNFSLDIKQGQYNETSMTEYQNVSIFQNTSAVLYLNQTTANYTMYIDYDGDNVTDEERSPDSIETDFAPNATIISPANNSIYLFGEEITFNGTGTDLEDGILTNSSFIWITSNDGFIGTGNEFNTTNLSTGSHTVELYLNDSSGQIDIENVTITVIAPDLMIDASNISFSNPFLVESENVTINATIYNIGNDNSTNITVQFYDGNLSNGTQIGVNQTITSLNASENKTVSIDWNTTGEAGDNCIWVVVDPLNNINESDKENNQAQKNVFVNAPTLLHIIQAQTDKDIYLEGEGVFITCIVQNATGNISANVSAIIEKPDGTMNNVSLIERAIGGHYYKTFRNTSPSGLYNITLNANRTGFIDDNETLNFYVLDITPPSIVTNLSNDTGATWINWTWTNPNDLDFDHTLIYLNGAFKTTTSNSYYLAEELNESAIYQLGVRTVDKIGNINETWVNQTTTTKVKVSPVANFSYFSMNHTVNEIITFNASSSYDPDGNITTYFWDFGDGECATGIHTNYSYSSVGCYNVSLTVTDNDNLSDTMTKQIAISFVLNLTWTIHNTSEIPDTTIIALYHNASDGIDQFDIPDPGMPPGANFSVWLDAGLASPYDKLLLDARPPADAIYWNVIVQSFENTLINISVSWNINISTQLLGTGKLVIVDNKTGIDMMAYNNYSFTLQPFETRGVQIIFGKTFLTSLSSKWNIISPPYNQSIAKNDIIVWCNGTSYSWQNAVSNNIILGFIYKWNRDNQNYIITDNLTPGDGHWMYAYHDCDLWNRYLINQSNDNYITDLQQSWNLIGLPYDEIVQKENLTVLYNGTEYSWQNATTNNNEEGEPLILRFIYEWNTNTKNYLLIDGVNPGYGYWMYAYYNCKLLRPAT